jgi:hypothetical protein
MRLSSDILSSNDLEVPSLGGGGHPPAEPKKTNHGLDRIELQPVLSAVPLVTQLAG